MSPRIDAFLTRFAAGAGTVFTWHLVEVQACARVERQLRMVVTARHPPLCPLSAAATLEGPQTYGTASWVAASTALGLPYYHARQIALAADDEVKANPDIRARLLRICRLEEEAH